MARKAKKADAQLTPDLPLDDAVNSEPNDADETIEQAAQIEAALHDDHEFFKSATEALLFASTEPLTEAQFGAVMGQKQKSRLAEMVELLNLDYARTGRAFEILPVAGGYQFFTRRDYSGVLRRLSVERSRSRVSRAALETLAVVAYRGPATKTDIDEIRGVDSGGVLRTLLDRRLVAVKGRAQVVGKPLLYETTPEFLKHFGLSSLADLPRDSELTREWGQLQEPREQHSSSLDESTTAADDASPTNGHHNGHTILNLSSAAGEDQT